MDWNTFIPLATITVVTVGGIVVERIKARAATKREIAEAVATAIEAKLAPLHDRVGKIEESEPAALAAARSEAGQALAIATTVKADLAQHLEDEEERRDKARRIGKERDKAVADAVADIAKDVRKQGDDITRHGERWELFLKGQLVPGGKK